MTELTREQQRAIAIAEAEAKAKALSASKTSIGRPAVEVLGNVLGAIPAMVASGVDAAVTAPFLAGDEGSFVDAFVDRHQSVYPKAHQFFSPEVKTPEGQAFMEGLGKYGGQLQQSLQDTIVDPVVPDEVKSAPAQTNPFAVRTSPHSGSGLGVTNPFVAAALETGPGLIPASRVKVPGTQHVSPNIPLGPFRARSTTRVNLAARAQDRGYRISPNEAGQRLTGPAIAEGAGGIQKSRRTISENNQVVTDNLFVDRYKYPGTDNSILIKGDPITIDDLARVRNEWGKQYNALSGVGEIRINRFGRFPLQSKYFADLDRIARRLKNKDFPASTKEAAKVLDDLEGMRIEVFDADNAIDQIKYLRSKADNAYSPANPNRNPKMGKAYRDLAAALEEAIERGASRKLGPDNALVSQYRQARQTIAETYSIQDALDGGSVSARKIGKQLESRNPTPYADEIKEIGLFANQFKDNFQTHPKSQPLVSPLDLGSSAFGLTGLAVTQAMNADPLQMLMATAPAIFAASRPALRAAGRGNFPGFSGQRAARHTPEYNIGPLLGTTAAGLLGEAEQDRVPSVFNQ